MSLLERIIHEEEAKRHYDKPYFATDFYGESWNKCGLEICAPLKDFNMTAQEVRGFKVTEVVIKDPVVLKPIIRGGKKHYLIVTAWGAEATDELVVNQKMN